MFSSHLRSWEMVVPRKRSWEVQLLVYREKSRGGKNAALRGTGLCLSMRDVRDYHPVEDCRYRTVGL